MSTSRFPSTFLAFLFLRALDKSVSFLFSISLRRFRFSADLSPLCLAVKIVTIDNRSSASSPDSVSSTLMSEPSTTIFVSCLLKIHSTSSKAKRQRRSLWVTTTSSISLWYDRSKMDVKPLRFQLRPDPMSLMSSWSGHFCLRYSHCLSRSSFCFSELTRA